MAFIRCSRGDTAPEPLWVNKSRGELLGQTQKTDYFPKSSEEFFKWRKPRPPSGMNPPLPAHPMPNRWLIPRKPCFAIQQVSRLLGRTSPTGFTPCPGKAIFLPSPLWEPAPSCQHSQIIPFPRDFSLRPTHLLPGHLPSPVFPADVAPVPCHTTASRRAPASSSPLPPPRCIYVNHKICSTYMVNCEQRKQLSHPSQHRMAGCKI